MKVQKVSASLLEPPALSPRERERRERDRRIERMLNQLTPEIAFRVRPEGDEKLSTIEARIRTLAADRSQAVLLRRMEDSVVVGLRNGRAPK